MIQKVKVSEDGLDLLIKPFNKSVIFHPSDPLKKKDISLAYGQTIIAYQEWFQVDTKRDHPMIYEKKNLESLDVDISHLTLKEGDVLGSVIAILD